MGIVDQGAFVRAWAVQMQRCAWFFGAGASASAGLPTATQIRDDLLLRVYAERHQLRREDLHPNDPVIAAKLLEYFNDRNGMVAFGAPNDYSRAFELALPDEPARHRYLQHKLADKQPSYGQRILGALLSGGQADLVVTTNFDELIEEAAADAYSAVKPADGRRRLNVAALGSRDRARGVLEVESTPMLIKLHGDFRETSLKNLDSELASQDEVLRQAVIDLSRRYGIAVVGYSGRDDSIMEMLEAASRVDAAWPAGLWWFARDPDAIPERVRRLLQIASDNGRAAHLVRLGTFDELMGGLALQAELPAESRAFVDALRPQNRLAEASPPTETAQFGPVIRFNALPVLEAPTTALHAPLSGLTRTEFRKRVRALGYRGVAVNAGGSIWGWGDEEIFTKLAGATAEERTIDLTSGPLEPGLHALALEGLAKALGVALPARSLVTRRDYVVRLVEWDKLTPERAKALTAFREAYGGQITGRLAKKYGLNRDGEPREYAEAVRLHLEHRWGLAWLTFTPFTWVERWETADDEQEAIAGVGEWKRQRWVARKQNETWSRLIATWTAAMAPEPRPSNLPLTKALDGRRFGRFTLGPTSAYSRRAK
ncbi:SIR2 family protein [Promicromonospora alba]|uniref:SIR2 family protein n=1 Tax=Promicromonospora alba TaxID=1616110 RepID=A0ABV9HJJ6_9MICO